MSKIEGTKKFTVNGEDLTQAELMNVVKAYRAELGDSNYVNAVPDATNKNADLIAKIINENGLIDEYTDAVVKIGATIIRNPGEWDNPLSIFYKGEAPYGVAVEELAMGLYQGELAEEIIGEDNGMKALFTDYTNEIKVDYHAFDEPVIFPMTSLPLNALKNSLLSSGSHTAFYQSQFTALNNSVNQYAYKRIMDAVEDAINDESVRVVEVEDPRKDDGSAKDFLSKVQSISDLWNFISDEWNPQGLETHSSGLRRVLITTAEVKNDTGVKTLAAMFNEKYGVDVYNSIITVDKMPKIGDQEVLAFMADENFLGLYNRKNNVTEFFNPVTEKTNYYTHLHNLIILSRFSNQVVLVAKEDDKGKPEGPEEPETPEGPELPEEITDGTFVANSDGVVLGFSEDWDGHTDIIIPEEIDGVKIISIGERAFEDKGLTSVQFDSESIDINEYAFYKNPLTKIVINSDSITVDTYAFASTEGGVIYTDSEDAYVGDDGNVYIGDYRFAQTWELKGLSEQGEPETPETPEASPEEWFIIEDGVLKGFSDEWDGTTDIVIPNSVTSIGDFALEAKELTSVTLGNSVTRIGDFAFADNKLTSAVIPDSVTKIGEGAFEGNELTSVVIPDSVTVIEKLAFGWNQLTSVVIPDSVTEIYGYAFAENQLTSVVIPDSVTKIGEAAFRDNQLTSVVIPNSVTKIEEFAFNRNELTSVVLPDSVTEIEWGAFQGNPGGVVYASELEDDSWPTLRGYEFEDGWELRPLSEYEG